MNVAEKLDKVNSELDALRAEYKKLGEKINRKAKEQEKLLITLNTDNLKDPVWLLRNPTMPGVYEAINQLIKSLYGGEFNGPHPSGYIHDDYKPVQTNFNFWLRSYNKEITKETLKANCTHFVENFLHILDAVVEIESRWDNSFPKVQVVPFNVRSEESGLDFLGYCPADGRWYHYSQVYGRTNTKRVFDSWNDAFDFAYALASVDCDYDDD
jgi:hypothetical protein